MKARSIAFKRLPYARWNFSASKFWFYLSREGNMEKKQQGFYSKICAKKKNEHVHQNSSFTVRTLPEYASSVCVCVCYAKTDGEISAAVQNIANK